MRLANNMQDYGEGQRRSAQDLTNPTNESAALVPGNTDQEENSNMGMIDQLPSSNGLSNEKPPLSSQKDYMIQNDSNNLF